MKLSFLADQCIAGRSPWLALDLNKAALRQADDEVQHHIKDFQEDRRGLIKKRNP